MKKQCIHILISVVSIFFFQIIYADSSYVDKIAEAGSAVINSGFVILDERYIEPPYIISRKNLKIYINDVEIPKPVRHPGEKYAFENKDIKNLPGPDQKKLSKILEIAPLVYKSYLEKGDVLIFSSNGGYETFNQYTAVYEPSDHINRIRNSQPEFAKRLDTLFKSLLHIDEFNVEKSQPINNGYVFVECKYLDAPYVVERMGLGLFINNHLIEFPIESSFWNLQNEVKKSVNLTDPNLPSSVNEYSCCFDPDVLNYLSMKRAYLREYYPIEEAVVHIRDVYKDLPCVMQAQLDPNNIALLHVEWTDGSVDNIRLVPIHGRPPIKMDKESILERLEKNFKNYEECLQKGDYFFFDIQSGGTISGNSGNAIEILTKILPILGSSKSPDIKIREIKEAKLQFDDDFIKTLITKFAASSQLEARLKVLTGVK